MILQTIRVEETHNLGNYENVKIAVEGQLLPGETIEAATIDARKALHAMFAQYTGKPDQPEKQPKPEPEPKPKSATAQNAEPAEQSQQEMAHTTGNDENEDTREIVDFGDKKLQSIIKRIEAGVTRETVEKHFRFTPEAQRAIDACFNIN